MAGEFAEIRARLEAISEELADLAIVRLRESIDAGGTELPVDERRLTRARRAVEKAVTRTGESCLLEPVFHPGFIAEKVCGLGVCSWNAKMCACLGYLDLKGFEHTDESVWVSVAFAQNFDGRDEVACCESISDGDHIRKKPAVSRFWRLLHNAKKAHAGQACGGACKARGGIEQKGGDKDNGSHEMEGR